MSILTPPARRIDPRGQRFSAGAAFAVGAAPLGWLFVGAVGALQVLLAATGICVGCRLYVLRWWVPSLFARLFRRADELVGIPVRAPIRYVDR